MYYVLLFIWLSKSRRVRTRGPRLSRGRGRGGRGGGGGPSDASVPDELNLWAPVLLLPERGGGGTERCGRGRTVGNKRPLALDKRVVFLIL